ncbi:MAG: alpha/beta fold hydrolase, partial [Phycisphaerales bacterium]
MGHSTTSTGADTSPSRRDVLFAAAGIAGVGSAVAMGVAEPPRASVPLISSNGTHPMNTISVQDGTQIYFKDWGDPRGTPIVFSHGWPLSADAWESQMLFLAENGFRCIAHDRRGHGRSSQPWTGNDMDHYADDLA